MPFSEADRLLNSEANTMFDSYETGYRVLTYPVMYWYSLNLAVFNILIPSNLGFYWQINKAAFVESV